MRDEEISWVQAYERRMRRFNLEVILVALSVLTILIPWLFIVEWALFKIAVLSRHLYRRAIDPKDPKSRRSPSRLNSSPPRLGLLTGAADLESVPIGRLPSPRVVARLGERIRSPRSVTLQRDESIAVRY